jgi:hypothetical protein
MSLTPVLDFRALSTERARNNAVGFRVVQTGGACGNSLGQNGGGADPHPLSTQARAPAVGLNAPNPAEPRLRSVRASQFYRPETLAAKGVETKDLFAE